MKSAGNTKKREGERAKWDPLRRIKTERGFKEVVTCVYVSSGLIFWMTCLHLGVITALLLTLCFTLFSSQLFIFITLEFNLLSTRYCPRCLNIARVWGFCRVLFCVPHRNRQVIDRYCPQRLPCSPPVSTGTGEQELHHHLLTCFSQGVCVCVCMKII